MSKQCWLLTNAFRPFGSATSKIGTLRSIYLFCQGFRFFVCCLKCVQGWVASDQERSVCSSLVRYALQLILYILLFAICVLVSSTGYCLLSLVNFLRCCRPQQQQNKEDAMECSKWIVLIKDVLIIPWMFYLVSAQLDCPGQSVITWLFLLCVIWGQCELCLSCSILFILYY